MTLYTDYCISERQRQRQREARLFAYFNLGSCLADLDKRRGRVGDTRRTGSMCRKTMNGGILLPQLSQHAGWGGLRSTSKSSSPQPFQHGLHRMLADVPDSMRCCWRSASGDAGSRERRRSSRNPLAKGRSRPTGRGRCAWVCGRRPTAAMKTRTRHARRFTTFSRRTGCAEFWLLS